MGGARRWMTVVLMMIVAACGPARGEGIAPRGDARLISAEEIAQTPATSVYEIVQRLRPAWLQQRAAQGAYGYPTVYMGSQALGGVERLREMNSANVAEIRYLDPVQATSRFGRNVPFGVIQVVADIGG
ncbi:hypothetical protein [Longimicrobium sp.]|uniref:hypothetical protein n=1 Tax=Longimicrobium sp. TaxID=2029185 RepID=UPI002E32DF01|nr:hypothetical protein [Longimicrobium sp.]HEX6041036.1 hypothetical protein [Longimicrobium sp.]